MNLKGKYLGQLCWNEAETLLKQGWPLLLPIGAGCKEHGLHLPLENDLLLANGITERVLAGVEALALPPLTYGYYPAFLEYPGSVSVPAQTMTDTVVNICLCLHQQGGRYFYAVNTGISTVKALQPAKEELVHTGVPFDYCDLHKSFGDLESRLQTQSGGTHADELETSMMLYLCPDRVFMDKARPDYHGDAPGGLTRHPDGFGVIRPPGPGAILLGPRPTRTTVGGSLGRLRGGRNSPHEEHA